MNNKDCDIISDLLPLYVDGMTSPETNDFVDAHLAECEECRQMYEFMSGSFTDVLREGNKKKKNIRKFRKIRLRLLLYGYVLFLIAVLVYCFIDFARLL